MRVPLATIMAREMRLKIFWSRPSFGDVASAASHDIGARNAIESFLKSTKLWRCCECHWSRYWREKCDWNFWSRPSFGDVASAASHDIGTRNAIENFLKSTELWKCCSAASHDIGARNAIEIFEVDQALEMLRVPLVTILARQIRLKIFWSRPSFGDVARAASHDIGARNAIENILKSTELWRCCECH